MKRGLIYLAGATILALALVFIFVPGEYSVEYSNDGSANGVLLLPDLADKVNDVRRVEIISAGNRTVATLIKADGHWQIEQMGGYRANWPKLQGLLAGLAQAQVLEVKTDKPEYYPRLGVDDVTSDDAGSVLVRLGSGEEAIAVLVGHAAQGRSGQFARLQGASASVLLDRSLDVPSEQMDWTDSKIIDINASEVAEVEIIHPGKERLLLTKISADQTDFDLVGLPADREIKSSWAVNSIGAALSLLEMNSVRPADSIDWQDAVRMRLLMFSGVEIMADMVSVDGDYLVRLQASHPGANPMEVGNEDVSNRVMDINQRVNGWAYGINQPRFETLVKMPEDVLKPVETQ